MMALRAVAFLAAASSIAASVEIRRTPIRCRQLPPTHISYSHTPGPFTSYVATVLSELVRAHHRHDLVKAWADEAESRMQELSVEQLTALYSLLGAPSLLHIDRMTAACCCCG